MLNWKNLTPPEWRDASLQVSQSIQATGAAPPFEKEYVRKDGRRIPVLVGIVRLPGRDLHAVSFVLDLSDQKRAEKQCDRLMIERAALLDSVGDGIYGLDPNGRCNFVNRAGARILGYEAEECIGKSMHDLIHFKHADGLPYPKSDCPVASACQSGEENCAGDELVWRKDGTGVWVDYSYSPIIQNEHLHGSVVCFKDVSERKQAEAAIRASEERFRGAFTNAAAGLFITDLKGTILEVNPAFCEMTGYGDSELVGTLYQSIAHPSDLRRDTRVLRELLRKEIPGFVGVERFVKKDGSLLWARLSASVARDVSGEISNIICLIEDTTERLRAETDLRRSEERYRGIVENTHEGVCISDPDGNINFANRRLINMLGYPDGATLQYAQIRFKEDAEDIRARFERRRSGASESYETRLRTKDGKALWANMSASPLVDEEGKFSGELCMFTDITERKRLEEQLRQSQKMEAIGRLAGGIAHDFNNLLTVIFGYSGVLESKLSAEDPLQKNILDIRKAGERAAALTQKLLAFTRKQVQRPRVLSLNHLARETEPMLCRLIGENIGLSLDLDPAVGNVKADPGQMEQVLMNLCINARDAMPNGGKLLIATHKQEFDSGAASLRSLRPGPYVLLEITDTGCGMDEPTKARIFEPFYTTKDPGIGTGLGLSTVLGIVNQSGGVISVYSEINVGTAFKIYLPLVEDAATPVDQPKLPVCHAAGETILVVEDDAGIRALAGEVLRQKGYQILEAASGEQALALGDALSSVDLLLTDVIMTGMNGQELATQLSAAHPNVRVLYMSGYTENAITQQGLVDPSLSFLPKPFRPEELLSKVGAVLSRERGPAKVLIVDDDPQVRSFLATLLEADGYSVLQASNGKEAQARCQELTIDLVVTDLVMPEQEGLETIHVLARHWPGLPVIAISGAYGGAYLALAKKLGAQSVFRKPFQADKLLSEVRRLTRR